MTWKPIGTAPSNGHHFLAYEAGGEPSVYECWEAVTSDGICWMDWADTEPEPTHWMPLPAAPTHPTAEE